MTNELHYLLALGEHGRARADLTQFLADPEWIEGRAASEANGPLTQRVHNQIWRPTPYSPLK